MALTSLGGATAGGGAGLVGGVSCNEIFKAQHSYGHGTGRINFITYP